MIARDWIEIKADQMIRKAMSSQFRDDIFRNARDFHAEGYVMDVALHMALKYWEGNPITGKILGVDP